MKHCYIRVSKFFWGLLLWKSLIIVVSFFYNIVVATKLSSLGGATMNKNNENIFKFLNLPYDETLQIDYISVNGYCKEIHIS